MSVHELRQVIDFAVQCHPAILWDAMAIPQWSPVLKKRGKNTSHWTVETPLRIRWKMEILEVTPHVHTPQTFINLSTPKFYKLQWSSNPGVSTGLNPGWTRIADGSTRATTSRQVDKSHLAQRDVPRDRHGGRLLEQPLPGQAALETVVDWNWRNDWIELEVMMFMMFMMFMDFGGLHFFWHSSVSPWVSPCFSTRFDCFQTTSWILRDVESASTRGNLPSTNRYLDVSWCIWVSSVLGPRNHHHKKKRIYLSHLPRKPITRERNAGGDAPNDLKRRAALAGALVLAHYDIPSLRASSWCEPAKNEGLTVKPGVAEWQRWGSEQKRPQKFPGAITFIPRTSYSTLSS